MGDHWLALFKHISDTFLPMQPNTSRFSARQKRWIITACCILLVPITASSGPAQRKKKTVPCRNAQSQAEMNICWGKEYKAADVVLNQVYRQLLAMVEDEQKAQLKEAQLAWLEYRDKNCDFVADEYKGGSIRPAILATCLLNMTNNRTTELRSQIKERTLD
jgi:uncharacterized protein YecT (DUF1311 family)